MVETNESKTMTLQLDLLERDYVTRNIPILLRAMAGKEFTADDVHGVVEPPAHCNWYGGLFSQARRKLVKVGYRKSERKGRNGGVTTVWRCA